MHDVRGYHRLDTASLHHDPPGPTFSTHASMAGPRTEPETRRYHRWVTNIYNDCGPMVPDAPGVTLHCPFRTGPDRSPPRGSPVRRKNGGCDSMTGVGSVASLPDFGWEEWLVIIAVILLALKLLLDALRRFLFEEGDGHGTGHDISSGHDPGGSVRDTFGPPSPSSQIRASPPFGSPDPVTGPSRVPPRSSSGPYDGATFNITNISINDSVINRSPIGGEDREDP